MTAAGAPQDVDARDKPTAVRLIATSRVLSTVMVGEGRPSTSCLPSIAAFDQVLSAFPRAQAPQDVDARDKPEHDEKGEHRRRVIRVPTGVEKTKVRCFGRFRDECRLSTGHPWVKPGHDDRGRRFRVPALPGGHAYEIASSSSAAWVGASSGLRRSTGRPSKALSAAAVRSVKCTSPLDSISAMPSKGSERRLTATASSWDQCAGKSSSTLPWLARIG